MKHILNFPVKQSPLFSLLLLTALLCFSGEAQAQFFKINFNANAVDSDGVPISCPAISGRYEVWTQGSCESSRKVGAFAFGSNSNGLNFLKWSGPEPCSAYTYTIKFSSSVPGFSAPPNYVFVATGSRVGRTVTFTYTGPELPDLPNLSAPYTKVCPATDATINIEGDLNAADRWQVYTDGCGGTPLLATAANSFIVSPDATATYYVRGEGDALSQFCSCRSIQINVVSAPAISISGDATICPNTSTTLTSTRTNGSGGCSVQWQQSPPGENNWTSAGANGNTLVLTPDATTDYRAIYDCTRADCPAAFSNVTTITVADDGPPQAVCRDASVQLDADGYGSISIATVDNGSHDACGISDLSLDQTSFDCGDLGSRIVTLTAMDNYGKISTCIAAITVEDQTAPVALCRDITVYVDDEGKAEITADQIDNGSYDNCAIEELWLSQTVFGCPYPEEPDDPLSGNVTLQVVDLSGNTASCTATVTTVDNIPPVATCKDAVVYLDQNGWAAIYTGSPILESVTDNCDLDISKTQVLTFSCDDLGGHMMTYVATDASGNASSCSGTLWVKDEIAPVIANCPNDIVVNTSDYNPGDCNAAVSWTHPSLSDNCSLGGGTTAFQYTLSGATISSQSQSISDYSGSGSVSETFQAGVVTVTYTATDANGQSAEACSFNINVVDDEQAVVQTAPKAKLWPPDYTYQTFTVGQMIASLNDNCGVLDLGQITIISAHSDEAEDAPGSQDGYTLNDIVIALDCRSVQVRRERIGGGNGRVYTITLAAQDVGGNFVYADYKIQVPKWAWGWGSEATDDGANYVVNGNCGTTESSVAPVLIQENVPAPSLYAPSIIENKSLEKLKIYPNPFDTETVIAFSLPEITSVYLEIFDIQGRRVKHWPVRELLAGEHQLKWEGVDDGGQALAPGLYLLQMKAGEKTWVKKVSLQRR